MENRKPKIYIVCGKARHGKDTVSEIIRNYYTEKGLKVLNLQYSSYIKEYAKKISNWDGSEETKPRELLQHLGTEVIRKNIDNLFFVNRICEDISGFYPTSILDLAIKIKLHTFPFNHCISNRTSVKCFIFFKISYICKIRRCRIISRS